MSFITKTVRLEDVMINDIEDVILVLNKEAGIDLYDFTSVIKLSVSDFINTEKIQNLLSQYKDCNTNDLLSASEKSLAKDWLRKEEDEAWKDL